MPPTAPPAATTERSASKLAGSGTQPGAQAGGAQLPLLPPTWCVACSRADERGEAGERCESIVEGTALPSSTVVAATTSAARGGGGGGRACNSTAARGTSAAAMGRGGSGVSPPATPTPVDTAPLARAASPARGAGTSLASAAAASLAIASCRASARLLGSPGARRGKSVEARKGRGGWGLALWETGGGRACRWARGARTPCSCPPSPAAAS